MTDIERVIDAMARLRELIVVILGERSSALRDWDRVERALRLAMRNTRRINGS